MFDKEYTFRGIHAFEVKSMVPQNDGTKYFPVFKRNFDIYLIAPIVGFMYGRHAEIDVSDNIKTDIFTEILINNKENLMYNYRLIMLLDDEYESDFNERINKAFKYYSSEKSVDDEKRYNAYVLGGVDFIYEKIIKNSITIDDCLNHLYDFIEDFNDRYGDKVNKINMEELFKLADV
jgi:hypothetical protein